MSVSVGDKVQIKIGGIDVTNGVKSKAGQKYAEGGPNWATVSKIVENWNTGGQFGLPNRVTKVVCKNGDTVVWQVRPEDIASQSIKADEPPVTEAPAVVTPVAIDPTPIPGITYDDGDKKKTLDTTQTISNAPYASEKGSSVWTEGIKSVANTSTPTQGTPAQVKTVITNETKVAVQNNVGYSTERYKPKGKEGVLPTSVKATEVRAMTHTNLWQDRSKRRELRNQDTTKIQNGNKFPYHNGERGAMLADRYDYQIIPGDPRYPLTNSLEKQLTQIRSDLGIQVHGNNNIARSVKFYMYNRYKVPDTNLLHNKTVTHIFFTRPDLNLLKNASVANEQTLNHTDTALLWRRNPEIFKLLTDYSRCGDSNNFNMLLSNQIASISLDDETLATIRAGGSWAEHQIIYGEQYTGRTAGTLSCTFTETSEFSVINLLKLWMTYIDNVSRGAWSPNYEEGHCHVHDRALDYGASVYVFKCGPDGEDVLYWSKYYGIFPTTSGAGALSWNNGDPIGTTPSLNISFAYSYKRDMSPISLLEFNHVANVDEKSVEWVPAFSWNHSHCIKPYVGAPYIEMDLGVPNLETNDVSRTSKRTQIRLKFREDTSSRRTDKILYQSGGSSNLSTNMTK